MKQFENSLLDKKENYKEHWNLRVVSNLFFASCLARSLSSDSSLSLSIAASILTKHIDKRA